ncbi:TPA: LPD38 domain-containing protein [Vibrio harveyi]
MDINEFNKIMGYDGSQDIQQNTGILGDVVDLGQKGIYDTAGSVADFVGADQVAKKLYGLGEEQMQTLSPEMQHSMQKQIFTEDDKGNIKLGEGAGDWRTWVGNTAQLAGQFVPQIAVGGGAGLLGRAIGASGKALAAIQAGTGGAFGGASANALAGKSAYESVNDMDWNTLSQSKLFQEVVRKKSKEAPDADPTMILNDAKEEVAQFVRDNVTYDPSLFAINSALDAVGDKFLVEGLLNKLGTKSVKGAALKGGLTEGITEGTQGGYEQYTSNVAQQQANPNINPMQGVASGALNEGVLGGVIGGAASGTGRLIGGQPKVDTNQSDAQKGDVNASSNDLTSAERPRRIQGFVEENIPKGNAPTPQDLIGGQIAGGIQPMTRSEAAARAIDPFAQQQEVPVIPQENAESLNFEEPEPTAPQQGEPVPLEIEEDNIPLEPYDSGIEPNLPEQSNTEVLPEEQPATEVSNTEVTPKQKTKAEKRSEAATALNLPQKKSSEKTADFEERLNKATDHYKNISSQLESGEFENLTRDELADIANDVGEKVLKKDNRKTLREKVKNWHGSVETKKEARQGQRTAEAEVSTLIDNNADVPLSTLKDWQKNYTAANRSKAKTQVTTPIPNVYSQGDVEITQALGLDKVPSPDSQTRKDNPAFHDMDELMKASDGGDINKYIDDAGIRDQVEQYLVGVENNINPTDGDGGITESLGLPKDANVKRLVAESIYSRKNDILDAMDQPKLKQMREQRDQAAAAGREKTKNNVEVIKGNRERETETMVRARKLPIDEAVQEVDTYVHEPVQSAIAPLVRDGLTEEQAIERTKRIKQRGMLKSLVEDKVGLDAAQQLTKQFDTNDFSQDPVKQTKEFLASIGQEGTTEVVQPMEEYQWKLPKSDESETIRYNPDSGDFESKSGDNSWTTINKRQAKRFLKEVGLSAPEGYGVKPATAPVVEENDEVLAAQAEAERESNALLEKKQEEAAKRKEREIKKKQESEQVGTFNNADQAMDYARQWNLTETHYPDIEGESKRRQNAKDWTLRKMPTEKLPNDYIATLFRDPTGKWGDRYFVTGENLQALKPYAAQHWGGKDYKFQLAPKWAIDRGVDLAKGEKVLNVPRDAKFLVTLQDAGAYIDTDDYSAMDAMGTAPASNTQVTPEEAEIDRQLKEGIEVTMSPSGKIQEAKPKKKPRTIASYGEYQGEGNPNQLQKAVRDYSDGEAYYEAMRLLKIGDSTAIANAKKVVKQWYPSWSDERQQAYDDALSSASNTQVTPKTEVTQQATKVENESITTVIQDVANNPLIQTLQDASNLYDEKKSSRVKGYELEPAAIKVSKAMTEKGAPTTDTYAFGNLIRSEYPTDRQRAIDLAKEYLNEPTPPTTPNQGSEKPSTKGKDNKIFTQDKYEAARAALRKKLAQLNSGFDPEMLSLGIQIAGYHIESGARKFTDFAKSVLDDMGENARPYLRSWYEGVRHFPDVDTSEMTPAAEIDQINIDEIGKENVPSGQRDLESDSGNTSEEIRQSGLPQSVPPKRTTEASSTIDTARRADEKRDERQISNSVSENQPDTDGAGSDSKLYSSDGSAGVKSSVTRPFQSERSHGDNGQRNVVKSEGEISTSATPTGTIPSREERVRLQAEAESKPSKQGDLANIRETLPILLPEQQEDVHFAEQRFANKGHGVHFANGTGTGKTFSGLGIVKRHQREGKNNILIVTPSNEINKEWFNAAPMFNMEIKALANKQDAGEGVVITTYANFRDNWAIGTREWDAVVMDESHNLLQKDSVEATTALTTLRAITGHPRGENRLNMLLNPEVGKPYSELENQLKKLQVEIDALEAPNTRGKKPVLTATEKEKLLNLKSQAESIQAKMKPLYEKLAKTLPKSKEIAQKRWANNKTNTVMLSATPWSYRKSVSLSEGFLFDYPEVEKSGAYNAPDSQQKFFMDTFGYEMKYNKLNEPDAKVDTGLLEREFNEQLKESGALRARMLEVEYDYDRKFELIDGGIGSRIDAGFAYLRDKVREIRKTAEVFARDSDDYNKAQERIRSWDALYSLLNSSFDYQQQIYLLEAIKAKAAIPYIRKHLELGRKVVVFHGYNKGLEPNVETGERIAYRPFMVDENSLDQGLYDAWNEFKTERPDLAELEITDLSKPIDTFQREFTKELALVNGTVSKKEAQNGIEQFNKDGSGTDVILVQQDKGSAGISLHDKTGKHQRVLINLGIPVKPTQSIQIEGRIYRVNLMSDAMFRYFNTGLNFERRMFASRMATRAGTTENLAMGNQARALKENMVEAFEDSQDWGVGFKGEGTGGKASDRASNTEVTQWDIAKTYYYKQQKKTSKTKAQEGTDYFATPEPLGLKLVEWISLNKGDKVLEPSAGHGAVSRWFPDGTFGHIVEPSSSLFPRAQMATNSLDKAHNMTFEEFGTNNKFNGIAMNPPYGKGGKVAMEHVAKAFMHLRRGGRITAVVPNGPAFQKRFDAWLANEPNANHVATVTLPSSTFGRAGTSVNTKVITIDYIPSNIPRTQSHADIDLSHAKDVAELFDYLEDTALPPRQEIADIDVDEVMEDANLKVKKRPKSKARPARWSVTGSGTYRYKEAIKASASSEETKPRWNRADSAWEFPEENGNPSEAIADNVLKVQRGEVLTEDVMFRRDSGETITQNQKLTVKDVKSEALSFISKFKHLNISPDNIKVAEKPSDLYGEGAKYLDGTTKGAYNPETGQLHLFAGAVSGDTSVRMSEDLRATLTHELLVHKGIDVFSNNQIETLFNEILASAKTSKDFADLVNSTLKSYPSGAFGESVFTDASNPTLDNLTPEGRKLIAEEMFAAISESANENKLQNPTNLPNRVVNAIKTMVRKLLIKAGLSRYVTRDMFMPEVYRIAELLNNDVLPRRSDGSARYQGTMRRAVSNEQQAVEARSLAKFKPAREDKGITLTSIAKSVKSLNRNVVAEWWDKFGDLLRQKVVDKYDALRKLDKQIFTDGDELSDVTRSSWVLAKMAGAANGVIEAAMSYGRVRYDEESKTIVPINENDKSGGFINMLRSIGSANEISFFLQWIASERAAEINRKADKASADAAATRAQIRQLENQINGTAWDTNNMLASAQLQELTIQRDQLQKQLKELDKQAGIRERFLSEQDIADGLKLIDFNGEDGKPRRAKFEAKYKEFKQYQNDFIDIGVKTGVISQADASMWRDQFYIPFYRVMEEQDKNGVPLRASGLTRQEAFKRFKGADMQVEDLLNNVIKNQQAIVTAGLKNQAAVQAMDNALEMGLVNQTTEYKRNKKASTWVMREGKKVWYNVDDPLLFDALGSLDPAQINFVGFKTASAFKRRFTDIISMSPSFIARNFVRDTVQSKTAANTELKDSMYYMRNTIGKMDFDKALMLTTGASFTFESTYAETSIDKEFSSSKVISPNDSLGAIQSKGAKALKAYRDVANAAENANRYAVFKAAKREGKNNLQAALEARDIMDFGITGSASWVRALISIVPFLNARIQGLDKLARVNGFYNAINAKTPSATEKQQMRRFWAVTALLGTATAVLHAVNVGDDDSEEKYRKLSDEQRDANWYVGGFLIPKPQELAGFFLSPIERMMDEFVYDRAQEGAAKEYMYRTLMNTFSFNPTPQLVKPLVEVYMNKNMYTDREIENSWERDKSKYLIFDHNSSEGAKAFAGAFASVFGDSPFSPKQIDHMIYGYTGWIGKLTSDFVSATVSAVSDNPRPASYLADSLLARPFIHGFYVGDTPRYTADQKRLYDLTQEFHRDFKDYQTMMKLGDIEGANALRKERGERIKLSKILLKVQRRVSNLNKLKQRVRMDSSLTAAQKRDQIGQIQMQQSAISANIIARLNKMGIR